MSLAGSTPTWLELSPATLAGALATIALLAAWRQAMHARRRGDAGWRIGLLVLAPFAVAALLWTTLAPPAQPRPAGTLVVATAASPGAITLVAGEHLIALPEAPALSVRGPSGPMTAAAEAVPDLATALRRHPQTRALRVLGAGLPARDRDAARGLAMAFAPAPLPAGIVELQAPLRLPAGRRFVVRGRVEGGVGQRIELLDPAGAVRARRTLADDGRFALAAPGGPPGRLSFRLQRRDAGGAVLQTLALPLQVDAGAPLRLLVLAGGVNPELKYLRRWALDAGFDLTTQASVGGGVEIGQPAAAPTAARLADVDLVVLDERSWRALGAGGRALLRESVRSGGLGVLLRLAADPSADERAWLREWGFAVDVAELGREVRLAGSEDAASDGAPPLSRRPLRLAAADGAPLLRDRDGEALAVWRSEGRGRIAVWNLGDTFRLHLAGRRAAYGELWAAATGTLARARGGADSEPIAPGRVDERSAICALDGAAHVIAPDGSRSALLRDPASGAATCAGFWPTRPGWHTLVRGEGDTALATPFLVRAGDDAPGLARAELRDATLAMAANASPAASSATTTMQPGPRWPWFLAWLAAAAATWWFERSRLGRARQA